MKRTKGPWEAIKVPAPQYGENAYTFEVRSYNGNAITGLTRLTQGEGDTYLIAAAPELLEGAKKIIKALPAGVVEKLNDCIGIRSTNHIREALEILCKAIAKAENKISIECK